MSTDLVISSSRTRAAIAAIYASMVACLASIPLTAHAQATTTTFAYDLNDNLVKITDPLGRVTDIGYDGVNRLSTRTGIASANGVARPVVAYSYDSLNQLSTVRDPRNLTTTYTVDGLGNQNALSSPDTGNASMTYDAVGNILSSTDARGKTTNHTYDVLNRLTRTSYATGTASTFEYDGGPGGPASEIGNLTRITDESGLTTFTHDLSGRVLTKTQVVTAGGANARFVVRYTYGTSGPALGKLESMTYPSGARVNYAYDSGGRVNGVTLSHSSTTSETPLLTEVTYTPTGAVQSWKWGNQALPSYQRTYDLDDRLTSYPVDLVGTVRTVSYNAASLVKAYSHTGGPTPAQYDQTFDYDTTDRLTSFTLGGVTTTYTYDANGNRTQQTGPNVMYTYNASSNRLNSATFSMPRTYSYDNAGNRTGDGFQAYIYSDRGRLTQVRGNTQLDMYYNALEQRVLKAGEGDSTVYVYDEDGKPTGEYSQANQKSVETVYLADIPIAVVMADSYFYVLNDHLNTPLVLTQLNGSTVWDWRNRDPFGNGLPVVSSASPIYDHRLPGQVFDKETGFYYNYFRDYDPQTGRYVESDPIGLAGGSLSTYVYVNANPLSYADPSGLQPAAALPVVGGACAGTGGAGCAAAAVAAIGVGSYWVTDRYLNPWLQPKIAEAVDWCMAQANNQSTAMHDSGNRRARQHEAAKSRCTPPNPSPGANCSELSKMIDMLKNSIDRYTYFDSTYTPERHAGKISEIENRIKSLKERYNKECTTCK